MIANTAEKETRREELRKLAEAATPGPWEQDCTVESDGAYGSGEDSREGYSTYAIFDADGKVIFDFLNSEIVCVHDEDHEDGHNAWDETAKHNAAFIAAANPQTVLALLQKNEALRKAVQPQAIGPDARDAGRAGDVLVYWPIFKLNGDGELTDEMTGGRWIISRCDSNGAWEDHDTFDAIGTWAGDDEEYGREPLLWLPLPTDEITDAALATPSQAKGGEK